MNLEEEGWQNLKREYDASCARLTRATRGQLTTELNQLLRRFQHYENEAGWVSILIEGASQFARCVAVFSVERPDLRLRGQAQMDLASELKFPISSAAAFASVIDTRDPVTALRTPSEVTGYLAVSLKSERAHLIPLLNGERTVAVLFASDDESLDMNGLELIAGIASAVLERQANQALHKQITPVALSPVVDPNGKSSAKPDQRKLPSWEELDEKQRSFHLRAQRFSRVTVAEMQLAKPEACRAGREQSNLYLLLKNEIDAARETYREQFMTIPTMVDYLHLELVRAAAEGDELKLGAEYPGQLV